MEVKGDKRRREKRKKRRKRGRRRRGRRKKLEETVEIGKDERRTTEQAYMLDRTQEIRIYK